MFVKFFANLKKLAEYVKNPSISGAPDFFVLIGDLFKQGSAFWEDISDNFKLVDQPKAVGSIEAPAVAVQVPVGCDADCPEDQVLWCVEKLEKEHTKSKGVAATPVDGIMSEFLLAAFKQLIVKFLLNTKRV